MLHRAVVRIKYCDMHETNSTSLARRDCLVNVRLFPSVANRECHPLSSGEEP